MSKPQRRLTTFDSAVDPWIAAMLLATPVASLAIGSVLLIQQRFGDASIIWVTGALAVALTAAFTFPCRYTLLEDTLSVRCGLVCYSIPYSIIEGAEHSSSWLSGPALSLRRVRIMTSRRSYLLSPKDREGFLEELQRRMEASKG